MASGEITVTCPNCQHRATLPVAAVRRDNFYCSRCMERIPMAGIRTNSFDGSSATARPKKSSRGARR